MADKLGKNGKAHVFEISNRVAIQQISATDLGEIRSDLSSHTASGNINAHQISNINGLQTILNNKEPMISVKNTAFNKDFGTILNTVCQGNDSRLSNSRTPTVHTHSIADVVSLESVLSGKQDTISGYTGSITVVLSVNFISETVTTGTLNITNGIITSIN